MRCTAEAGVGAVGRPDLHGQERELAHGLAHQREPVVLVVDHERVGQADARGMLAQDAHARRVERGDEMRHRVLAADLEPGLRGA